MSAKQIRVDDSFIRELELIKKNLKDNYPNKVWTDPKATKHLAQYLKTLRTNKL